jgi:hypothetical protein
MKPLRWIIMLWCVFAVTGAAADPDGNEPSKDVRDQIQGKWHGEKGTCAATDTLTIKKYKEGFKPGTAGDYSFAELRSNLVGSGGKKLPPTDVTVGTGSYSLDGNKLILSPGAVAGPVGKSKVVWEVVKVTDDTLVFKTDKGKAEEFKKAR